MLVRSKRMTHCEGQRTFQPRGRRCKPGEKFFLLVIQFAEVARYEWRGDDGRAPGLFGKHPDLSALHSAKRRDL